MKPNKIAELNTAEEQLETLYNEIGKLSQKNPNDLVNKFKLQLINNLLVKANSILGEENLPFPDFTIFDTENLPSNSDVVVILSQYLKKIEIIRRNNRSSRIGTDFNF